MKNMLIRTVLALAAVAGLVTLSIMSFIGVEAATASAPAVSTLAASGVTATTATFNGTVNPNGLATTVWFQWTPTDGGTSTVSVLPAGTTAKPVSVTITGLQPSKAYQYKIVAANSKGQKSGSLVKPTTLATAPTPPSPPTADKTLYLTFDDGPTAGYTTQVLAYLNAARAHATFFEIGQSTYTNSGMCPGTASYATCLANAGNSSYGNYGLMKQIVADGDQVGTHTWDHPAFNTLTDAQATAEISQARSLQTAVTGRDSKLFRFPYNIATAAANQYLASQGVQSIGADLDPSDWSWRTVSDTAVTSYVMSHVTDGAVVQLHDGQDVLGRDNGSPGYLPGLLAQLKDAGYKFGTLTLGGPYPTNIIKVGPAGKA